MNTIKRGDIVTFKPEWRDPGDDQFTFRAIEDEDGGRVKIEALGVLDCFNPVSVVQVSMIERAIR